MANSEPNIKYIRSTVEFYPSMNRASVTKSDSNLRILFLQRCIRYISTMKRQSSWLVKTKRPNASQFLGQFPNNIMKSSLPGTKICSIHFPVCSWPRLSFCPISKTLVPLKKDLPTYDIQY